MIRKIFLVLVVMLFLAPLAYATGINVYIDQGAIKDKDGNVLADGNYHPYQSRLEFFHNSLPAPNSSSGRLSIDLQTQYTVAGTRYKYQLSSLDGGTLHVRVWKDTPSGNHQGNYYGKTSHGVAGGTTLPYDWFISDLRTLYKADVPYKPTIGSITEAMVRVGDDLELSLTIPVQYDENGPDGKREITGRSLEIVYPDGSKETRDGSSITLNNAPTGTYSFTPIATNWYGSTRGDAVSYTTLAMVAGKPVAFQFDLLKSEADRLIVNPITIPGKDLTSPEVTTVEWASQLATVINSAAGKVIVSAVYKWDPATGSPVGINFDKDGKIVTGSDFAIVPGVGYQVYTTENINITFEGQ